MSWYAFTLWRREPDDDGRSFSIRFVLTDGAGRALLEGPTQTFALPAREHREYTRFPAFPIGRKVGQAQSFQLKLQMQGPGQEGWVEKSAYQISVIANFEQSPAQP